MPALTSALTWDGKAAANWPSLNSVARSPFCLSALSKAGVWLLDGPSSKVSPTYPLQAAACDGAALTVKATVPAAASAATASPVTRERFDRCGSVRMCQPTVIFEFPLLWNPSVARIM
jgi:hypothetical protein